ncbi:MAG: hypothetical protein ACREDO_00555 [Methyloceanibacter sp.]
MIRRFGIYVHLDIELRCQLTVADSIRLQIHLRDEFARMWTIVHSQ